MKRLVRKELKAEIGAAPNFKNPLIIIRQGGSLTDEARDKLPPEVQRSLQKTQVEVSPTEAIVNTNQALRIDGVVVRPEKKGRNSIQLPENTQVQLLNPENLLGVGVIRVPARK